VGHKLEGSGLHGFQYATLLTLVSRGWHTNNALEQSGECAQAIKTNVQAGVGYGATFCEQDFCLVDAERDQVLMRRLAISAAEEADEVEFGEMGLIGDVVKVDGFCKMGVHKKLSLHDAAVEVDLGIAFVRGSHFAKLIFI
jgi:hypothetical protein